MKKSDSSPAARITLIYALFAGLWILLSDRVLEAIVSDPHLISRFQTYKGWAFVIVSAAGLYALLQKEIRLLNQVEEAHRAELRSYADIFQHTQVGVGVGSADGKALQVVNPAFASTHGYTVEELVGQPIELVFAPESRAELPQQIQIAHERGHYVFEAQHVRKDGTFFPALIDVTTVKDENQKVLYRIANVQDVSELKITEARLQNQLRRLAALRAIDIAITSTLDERVIFSILLDEVITQLNADAAAVLLLDPATQRLEYTASRGFQTSVILQTSLGQGEGLAWEVVEKLNMVNLWDLARAEHKFRRQELVDGEGFQAYYGVPLIAKGHIKGVLEVFHRQAFQPDQEWVDFLEALAGQAAIAIDNTSLYEKLQRSSRELAQAYDATLVGWSRALELRDRETQGHSSRVTEMTVKVARVMGLDVEALVNLRRGTLLHDIGKMGVPDNILLKSGPLDEYEWEVMRRHPAYAYEMLAPISFLRPALDIPYCHHERWDGSGYPRGLQYEEIPLGARIFAVVDVWDALRSDRPYRQAWSFEQARRYISSKAGTHFDPHVVEVFMGIIETERPAPRVFERPSMPDREH